MDICYYLQDELGGSIRLMDEKGHLAEIYGYDEFGRDLYGSREETIERDVTGSIQPFGYTGYQYDKTAGTYYAQAREYRAELGRFEAVDAVEGSLLLHQTQNQYKYCLNQPFRYIDPTGCTEECTDNELDEIIEEGAFGYIIDGLNISNAVMGTYLKKGIVNAVRPGNIGKGTWAKIVSQDLDDVARFCGASQDDVVRGLANAKVTGLFPKVLDKIGYVGALIDAGFVLGVGIYVVTDVIKVKGKSIRDNIKDGISGLFGWD